MLSGRCVCMCMSDRWGPGHCHHQETTNNRTVFTVRQGSGSTEKQTVPEGKMPRHTNTSSSKQVHMIQGHRCDPHTHLRAEHMPTNTCTFIAAESPDTKEHTVAQPSECPSNLVLGPGRGGSLYLRDSLARHSSAGFPI